MCVICETQDLALLMASLPSELCAEHRSLRRRWKQAQRELPQSDWVFDVLQAQLHQR